MANWFQEENSNHSIGHQKENGSTQKGVLWVNFPKNVAAVYY